MGNSKRGLGANRGLLDVVRIRGNLRTGRTRDFESNLSRSVIDNKTLEIVIAHDDHESPDL